ncbi:MAG: hypothetical protein LV479_12490 [Methylacidiphilales bacterium]|nr:hypothetical protein [Candidatus Methylacidiphilales bacterium]
MRSLLAIPALGTCLALGVCLASTPAQTPPPLPPRLLPTANDNPPSNPGQTAVDRLSKSNAELLDLLKQQQSVLEDIQYDRRLQSRQIQLLEERLEETIQENARLQAKVDSLSAQMATANSTKQGSPATGAGLDSNVPPTPTPIPTPTPTPTPASYLPPAETESPAGGMSWHRLFTNSGADNLTTDVFHIQGRQWRILWHNQDKPGKTYENTSALFINAFPRNDTIPQKICSKLGSGGDSTELLGPGDFYLKIEASGGNWECAVEDFR